MGVPDYVNNYAPASKKCHMFAPEGAGAIWQNPAKALNTGALAPTITGRIGVHGTSATCANGAIVLLVPVTRDICLRINDDLKVANTGGNPPQWSVGPAALDGGNFMRYGFNSHTNNLNMACGGNIGGSGGPAGAELKKMLSGCFQSTTGVKPYFYYNVLAWN